LDCFIHEVTHPRSAWRNCWDQFLIRRSARAASFTGSISPAISLLVKLVQSALRQRLIFQLGLCPMQPAASVRQDALGLTGYEMVVLDDQNTSTSPPPNWHLRHTCSHCAATASLDPADITALPQGAICDQAILNARQRSMYPDTYEQGHSNQMLVTPYCWSSTISPTRSGSSSIHFANRPPDNIRASFS
jgi:hypothetical protein